jgi:hypothetical protein
METLSQARLKKQWPVKIFSESRLLSGNKGQQNVLREKRKNFYIFPLDFPATPICDIWFTKNICSVLF